MRLVEIPLAAATRQAIAEQFLELARGGTDVQDFDPQARNPGNRPSTADQHGFYGDVDGRLLRDLGERLSDILSRHDEVEALCWFRKVRQLPEGGLTGAEDIAPVHILHILPDLLATIEPEDLRSPNGLRIPDSIRDEDAIREYSARLLLPKLVLAAVAGLTETSPWVDPDMDLGSAVHTIRPDAERLAESSGYGAGPLTCHTDGYWSEQDRVPAWNVMLCAANPFGEPTTFVRVADVFRILDERHVDYDMWEAQFSELRRPGQSPRQFVTWVLDEAVKPQFDFVMGSIGAGAFRSVSGVPLLEKHRTLPGFLFRYKSTMSTTSRDAQAVVEFVNRMVTLLSRGPGGGLRRAVELRPGAMAFALNGCCLRVEAPSEDSVDSAVYPVSGNATIHGREALRVVGSRVQRTILRCNLVASSNPAGSGESQAAFREGHVAMLLRSGYRANHLQR